jgi:hypothetical protein
MIRRGLLQMARCAGYDEAGYATADRTDEYRVLYRQFNDDILLRFASMLKAPAEKVMEQATLPFDEPQVVIAGSAAESQRRQRRAADQETRPAAPSKSRKKPRPK